MIRLALIVSLLASPALARKDPGPFRQGKSRISISGGSAGQFGERYIVIGGGFGYYVAHGLELGLDASFWFGAEPSITTVSPQARYVFWQVDTVKPYVGGFFRRQFTGELDGRDLPDYDSVGGRAGIFWVSGRTYVGVGVAYEQILSCDEDETETCTDVYPELALAISL